MSWAGNILWVDLSKEATWVEKLSEDLKDKFIGGRGVNVKLLSDMTGPDTDPLGEDNILVFGTGPLTGTGAPSSGRVNITAKSPLTGIIGDSNVGGHWGPELKYAGYDFIVVKGASSKPVYLVIDDELVEIRDGTRLWTKSTWETEDALREDLGREFQVLSIGPAGENVVRYANIISDYYRAAGRTGMGAVMGSKRLKAIAIRGTKGIRVARPHEFASAARKAFERIVTHPRYKWVSSLGALRDAKMLDRMGIFPTKNMLRSRVDGVEELYGEKLMPHAVGWTAGFNCPVHCTPYFMVDGERGLWGQSPRANPFVDFGSKLGITDFQFIFKMHLESLKLGLDVDSFGGTMAWAMECFEKGIIGPEDTDEIDLKWGNKQAVEDTFRAIVQRRGFGALLADGVRSASRKLGRGSAELALEIKGLELLVDMRPMPGWGLGHAISTRGADYLRGAPMWLDMSPEESKRRFGTEKAIDPFVEDGKPRCVKWVEEFMALVDMVEICKFPCVAVGGLKIEDVISLFQASTGYDLDEPQLLERSERVVNLERLYNTRHGLGRKDDNIPRRLMTEPLADGPYAGRVISPEMLSRLLDEYYDLRGWDKATGLPTDDRIKQLGLA